MIQAEEARQRGLEAARAAVVAFLPIVAFWALIAIAVIVK